MEGRNGRGFLNNIFLENQQARIFKGFFLRGPTSLDFLKNIFFNGLKDVDVLRNIFKVFTSVFVNNFFKDFRS